MHRGKQGFFLLRALWPRLTSSRFRIVGAFLTMAVLGALLLFSGAQQAKVAGVVQPPARKVVIFGMPGLTWDELRTKTPNLEALADDGAVADLMVKTASTSPSTHEAYASLGTGNPVKASLLAALALPRDADFESDNAANALTRRTGERPQGDIVVMGAAELQLSNESKHLSTDPGALGDALAAAGHRTAVVGNSDIDVVDDGSLQTARRPTGAAVMTGNGSVDAGAVGPELLVPRPRLRLRASRRPGGGRGCGRAGARPTPTSWWSTPVTSTGPTSSGGPSCPTRRSRRATAPSRPPTTSSGRIADRIDDDTLLIVTGVRPPRAAWRLSPAVMHGPGIPHGYANSPGTHRQGVATLFDLAPTVLTALGAEVPADLPGSADQVRGDDTRPAAARGPGPGRGRIRSEIFNSVTTIFVVGQAIVYLLIGALLVLRTSNRWLQQLRWLALAILAYPPATFLYRAIPDVAALGSAGLILLVLIDVLLVLLSQRTGKHPLAPALFLMGLTIAILVFDVATGNNLQLSSLLGLSLNSAGRYYGFGNISLALLAAGSIMLVTIVLDISTSKREVAIIGSGFLLFILVVDGAPVLGNDIGGIITLAPVFTVVIALMLGWRITWKTVIIGLTAAVGALALAAAADLLRPGDTHSHFGKLIDSIRDDGWQPLTDTIQRKLGALFRLVENSVWTRLIPIGVVYLGFVLGWRQRWKDVFARHPALRLGILASLAAGLLGSVVNDSGPIVLALVLSVVCPVVSLIVLQSEREVDPFLLEPTGPAAPAVPAEAPVPATTAGA